MDNKRFANTILRWSNCTARVHDVTIEFAIYSTIRIMNVQRSLRTHS